MIKKLKNNKGETLIEIMVSLLIITFTVIMLYTIVAASGDLTKNAGLMEDNHYENKTKAEIISNGNLRSDSGYTERNIEIKSVSGSLITNISDSFDINIYGKNGEELKSYVLSY